VEGQFLSFEKELARVAEAARIRHLEYVEDGQAAFEQMMAGRYAPSSVILGRMLRGAKDLRRFDEPFELLCKDFLETHIEMLRHQLEAAAIVFTQMNLRAILADEVGLGKTIEAGIIAKELETRGMLGSMLVVVPKTLVGQWQQELAEKFGMNVIDVSEPASRYIRDDSPYWITSSRSWYREGSGVRAAVSERKWDLVIMDEAHHLKNHRSKGYQSFLDLKSQYLLLLTATPLQNDLRELYSLIHLVRPGGLGSYLQFRQRYFGDSRGQEVQNQAELRRLVSENMVRRRRIECPGIDYTVRIPKTHSLPFPAESAAVYRAILGMEAMQAPGWALKKIQWLKRGASCMAALRSSLTKEQYDSPLFRPVWDAMQGVDRAGEPKFAQLLELGKGTRHLVVFTEYLDTQKAIRQLFEDTGSLVQELHGGMSTQKRRDAVLAFNDKGGVFVSSPAGREGLNLQFSNVMVNFDLPWNPMVVEQRIGRLHRIGQKQPVYIHTLSYKGTVEDFVLATLYRKLELFKLSVGEVDQILAGGAASDDEDFELESYLQRLVQSTASLENIEANLSRLTDRIEQRRQQGDVVTPLTSKVLG
jgi:SNF2 family DNA or RNA helicase